MGMITHDLQYYYSNGNYYKRGKNGEWVNEETGKKLEEDLE